MREATEYKVGAEVRLVGERYQGVVAEVTAVRQRELDVLVPAERRRGQKGGGRQARHRAGGLRLGRLPGGADARDVLRARRRKWGDAEAVAKVPIGAIVRTMSDPWWQIGAHEGESLDRRDPHARGQAQGVQPRRMG